MAKSREIGGNFPLENGHPQNGAPETSIICNKHFDRRLYTFSGRTAISFLISNIQCDKNVLLPDYTCDTCIRPFYEAGFSLNFYHIDRNGMEPDFENFVYALERFSHNQSGIIFLEDYFGFNTNKRIKYFLKSNPFSNLKIGKENHYQEIY